VFIDEYMRGIFYFSAVGDDLCENLCHRYGTLQNHPEELGKLHHPIGIPRVHKAVCDFGKI